MEKVKKDEFTLEQVVCEDQECPLDYADITLYNGHSRLSFGAREVSLTGTHSFLEAEVASRITGKSDITQKAIEALFEKEILIPVYLYNHGRYSLSLEPFGCAFDSGKLGYFHVSLKDLKEYFSIQKRTTKSRAAVLAYVKDLLPTLTSWLNGEVYEYEVTQPDGEYEYISDIITYGEPTAEDLECIMSGFEFIIKSYKEKNKHV